MFDKSIDARLSAWAQHRAELESSPTPLVDTWIFWKFAPFVPYNNKIDPFNKSAWPSPWQIIVDNKYDDFTKAIMLSWTLKLTERFSNHKIEIKTLVDRCTAINYNIVCIDEWALNYGDQGPIETINLPDYFFIENQVEL